MLKNIRKFKCVFTQVEVMECENGQSRKILSATNIHQRGKYIEREHLKRMKVLEIQKEAEKEILISVEKKEPASGINNWQNNGAEIYDFACSYLFNGNPSN